MKVFGKAVGNLKPALYKLTHPDAVGGGVPFRRSRAAYQCRQGSVQQRSEWLRRPACAD